MEMLLEDLALDSSDFSYNLEYRLLSSCNSH